MGRNPKIRVSYNDDAQYFIRLADAMERDTARPIQWRRPIIGQLNDLAAKFLKAPDRKEKTK